MQSCAVALGKYNIRANAILPGTIETYINKEDLSDLDKREYMVKRTALGRLGGRCFKHADYTADRDLSSSRYCRAGRLSGKWSGQVCYRGVPVSWWGLVRKSPVIIWVPQGINQFITCSRPAKDRSPEILILDHAFGSYGTSWGVRASPFTTAGFAAMRTEIHLADVVPDGFLHACIVPRWMTVSPGYFKCVSVPSSVIRISSPETKKDVVSHVTEKDKNCANPKYCNLGS